MEELIRETCRFKVERSGKDKPESDQTLTRQQMIARVRSNYQQILKLRQFAVLTFEEGIKRAFLDALDTTPLNLETPAFKDDIRKQLGTLLNNLMAHPDHFN